MKWIIVISALGLWQCQTKEQPAIVLPAPPAKPDSSGLVITEPSSAPCDSLFALVKKKPIWGDRLSVSGDFNGDSLKETLREQYISLKNGREVSKDYDWDAVDYTPDCDSYSQSVDWALEKEPAAILTCDNPAIGPYTVAQGQIFGLLYLNNEGDLNGDGTHEITCIVSQADYSNSNSCSVLTCKNGVWKEVATFPIMEFDFQYDPKTSKKPHPKYVFKKPDGAVYLKAFDGNQLGNVNWKRLKTNW